jgi:hypothetical protein
MAQVKIVMETKTNYDSQQNAEPPAGATKEHPLAPQPQPQPGATNYSSEQDQQKKRV